MIRLFIALVSFLSVSLGGLWYGSSTDAPLDDTSFENAPLTVKEKPAMAGESKTDVLAVAPPEKTMEEKKVSEVTPLVSTPEVPKEQPIDSGDLAIQSRILRFGFRVPPASRTIDTIVLHSSYNALGGDVYSVDRTIEEYEQYGVGAHYLIDRSGTIYRLIEEGNIAYHAGPSKMPDGRKNVNDFSIGIEMIATKESGYTDKQYTAVNALITDIKSRHKIKSVVGHGDIAPGRKTDPWKFNWKKIN
ncbi:MAG: N-acetylmuramoyl-L-alanine amidase [Candidatus Moraniibacteriota bacterium]